MKKVIGLFMAMALVLTFSIVVSATYYETTLSLSGNSQLTSSDRKYSSGTMICGVYPTSIYYSGIPMDVTLIKHNPIFGNDYMGTLSHYFNQTYAWYDYNWGRVSSGHYYQQFSTYQDTRIPRNQINANLHLYTR